MKRIAVLDACVLYPAPLRDILMRQAVQGLFAPRWSETIQEEWIRNLLASDPAKKRNALERTKRLMNDTFPEANVTAYRRLLPKLNLPDPDDRHVLAAAIKAGAETIVTFNLKDFPKTQLKPHGVQAQHPDDFLLELMASDGLLFLEGVRRQREGLKNPPLSVDQFLENLQAQGLKKTAGVLKNLSGHL